MGRTQGAKDLKPRKPRSPNKKPRMVPVNYPEYVQIKISTRQRSRLDELARSMNPEHPKISSVVRALIDSAWKKTCGKRANVSDG